MSTELKTLQGEIEIPNPPKMEPTYKSTELHLNRFYGGQERGTSLQIEFYNDLGNYNHIQDGCGIRLKVNNKDNTITIKKVKDNYSREEVNELFEKYDFEIKRFGILDEYKHNYLEIWKKENL